MPIANACGHLTCDNSRKQTRLSATVRNCPQPSAIVRRSSDRTRNGRFRSPSANSRLSNPCLSPHFTAGLGVLFLAAGEELKEKVIEDKEKLVGEMEKVIVKV